MPYRSNRELPSSIKDAIPSGKGRSLMREVINSQLGRGKSETVAFASAWSALERSGYSKDKSGKWKIIKKSKLDLELEEALKTRFNSNLCYNNDMNQIDKRQISDDAFTTDLEAKARSVDLGLEGAIHIYDMDGNAVFMPGATHDEYLERYKEMANIEDYEEEQEETNINIVININKAQEDQRLVFGWASVIEDNGSEVVDSQEDTISEDELEKAFYKFVENSRKAGEMHIHSKAGELVEMMVFTKEKQKALGIDLGKVGAWIGFRLEPEIFNKVKSGEYKMFSIGGKGKRIKDGE